MPHPPSRLARTLAAAGLLVWTASCDAGDPGQGTGLLGVGQRIRARLPRIGARVAMPAVSPASRGFDSARLEALREHLVARGTQTLLIVHRDAAIYEWYDRRDGRLRRIPLAAAAKGLVGAPTLLAALDDGLLELDAPASRILSAWREDPLRSRISIRQLASHSSGLEDVPFQVPHPHDWQDRYERDGSARFDMAIARVPLHFEPGARYGYSGPGYYVLAYVLASLLRDTPDRDAQRYYQRRVLEALDIPGGAWTLSYGRMHLQQGLRLCALGSGASLTARAMARIGQLMRDGGRYRGAQIIGAKWVAEALSPAVAARDARRLGIDHPEPGLGWYLNRDGFLASLPRDAFLAAGIGHQLVIAIPSLELVVVRTGSALGEAGWDAAFWRDLELEMLRPLARALAGGAS